MVKQIHFKNKVADSVEHVKFGKTFKVAAKKEIIISAGPINSPQLLMLSGVGPKEECQKTQVPLVHELPGVGKNLMDHLELYIQYECLKPISLYKFMNPLAKSMIGLNWMLRRDGLGSSNHFEAGGQPTADKNLPIGSCIYNFRVIISPHWLYVNLLTVV